MNKNRCGLLVVLLIFGFCLNACTDRVGSDEASSADAIQLTTSIGKSTRGTPVTSTTQMMDMGVFAHYTGSASWSEMGTGVVPNRMTNQKWTQNAGTWSTASPVKWGEDVSIADKFTFFAYSPYASATNGISVSKSTGTPELNYTVPSSFANQPDLMIAVAKDKHPIGGKVSLSYQHALTCLAFEVVGNGQTITGVKVQGVATSGTLTWNADGTPYWKTVGAATSTYIAGVKPGGVSAQETPTNLLTSDGYLMMIPQTLPANAKLVVTINGVDKTFNLTGVWTPGKIITYKIDSNLEMTVDYTTKELSNCYILNPNSSKDIYYKIPVSRVNEFWGPSGNTTYGSGNTSYAIGASDKWTVGLLWQSRSNGVVAGTTSSTGITLSKATGTGPNDYFEIRVPAGSIIGSFNFVIGLGKGTTTPKLAGSLSGAQGTILWSWHFWVTDYNPYETPTVLQTSSENGEPATGWAFQVTGGMLHRYTNDPAFNFTYNNFTNGIVSPWLNEYKPKKIMDRYCGYQALSSEYSMLVYQYGRKDPLPYSPNYVYILGSEYIVFSSSSSDYYKSNQATIAESVHNPLTYYRSPNWVSSTKLLGTNIVWNDPNVQVGGTLGKSIFDPSPWGFKVPENGTFNMFANGTDTTTPNLQLNTSQKCFEYSNIPGDYTYSAKFIYEGYTLMTSGFRGNGGSFWSSTPVSDSRAYMTELTTAPRVRPSVDDYRGTARAIRPIQE